MATSSGTTKTRPDNPNLTRSRSLGRKPKPAPSSDADGSDKKTAEKPVPNYLKPTISSRPGPVKFLKKNSAVEDKLLRRRSFDRPPSSLTSSISSSHNKSLNTSPARSRDRPVVPREKPATGLRSSSFHGSSSRGGLRGSSTLKSAPVASRGSPGVKKSGLSGGSSSKSKKEGSENVPKKSSPVAPPLEDEEEIIKVETHVQVSDHREEDREQVAQPYESVEEKEIHPMDASTEEEKEELINEDKTEEHKVPENNSEDKEEVEKKVDDEEENKKTVVTQDMKEAADIEETKEEEEAEVKEETTETKKEVVQGKKESPTAYNDVIASKMQESSRKNKVLALAGAFQTVIDYETAASK